MQIMQKILQQAAGQAFFTNSAKQKGYLSENISSLREQKLFIQER